MGCHGWRQVVFYTNNYNIYIYLFIYLFIYTCIDGRRIQHIHWWMMGRSEQIIYQKGFYLSSWGVNIEWRMFVSPSDHPVGWSCLRKSPLKSTFGISIRGAVELVKLRIHASTIGTIVVLSWQYRRRAKCFGQCHRYLKTGDTKIWLNSLWISPANLAEDQDLHELFSWKLSKWQLWLVGFAASHGIMATSRKIGRWIGSHASNTSCLHRKRLAPHKEATR